MSVRAHDMEMPSISDDYISVCYSLMYTVVGDQMWFPLTCSMKIREAKNEFLITDLQDDKLYTSESPEQVNKSIAAL